MIELYMAYYKKLIVKKEKSKWKFYFDVLIVPISLDKWHSLDSVIYPYLNVVIPW